MFPSSPPCPMLQKTEEEKRKKSYHYDFGHFVFYYILIICTTSINSMLTISICFQISS